MHNVFMFYVQIIWNINLYVAHRATRKINKIDATKRSYMIFNVLEKVINK